MWTPQQKVQCVLWFADYKSVTRVQRRARREFNIYPPTSKSILLWNRTLQANGSLIPKTGKHAKKQVSVQSINNVRNLFNQTPRTSIRSSSRILQIPKSTVHDILHKRLKFRAYKIRLLHQLKPNDRPLRLNFANEMLVRIDENPTFLQNVLFSDEATFHLSGVVNRHNCRIWGSRHPHASEMHERDTPKVNVWLGLKHNAVIGPFFFIEQTVTGHIYLDMLQNFAVPQMPEQIIFQQDGAPAHYHNDVRDFLNEQFPGSWIGRGGPIAWPARSPDLTPLDFFAWGFIKDIVYQVRVQSLRELRRRIVAAVERITPEMLNNVWRDIDYRLDLLRATYGDHIELY